MSDSEIQFALAARLQRNQFLRKLSEASGHSQAFAELIKQDDDSARSDAAHAAKRARDAAAKKA
jgi:hypothetical protein